jgi:hypothetical protein
MHDSQSIDRRFLIAITFLVLALGAVAALALARPAAAECPVTGCPGGGITHTTITHTLAVSRPPAGTITSDPSGISCPSGSGGDCTQSDSQTVTCTDGDCADPDPAGWATYALSASGGPSGFAASWGGACSGATCSVKLDADKTVSVTWSDVTNPSVSVSPGTSKVGPTLHASATASDNAAVSKVDFLVDGVLKATDTSAPYSVDIDMSGYSDGSSHTLLARAYDTSSRTADSSSTVTVDKQVALTLGTLPAYTNALSVPLSIGTDSDASMKCSVNGSTPATCSGSYSPSLPTDGSYTYTVAATDDVANTATATRTFIVDRTAPSASFTDGPSEGATVAAGDITISFDYSDANPVTVECAVDGGAYGPCQAAHSQTFGSVAPSSSHQVSLRVTDAAGNATQIVRHFSVTPPSTPPTTGGVGGSSQAVLGNQTFSKANLSSGFKLKGKSTLVRKLLVTGLPDGAKVSVRCTGHGCPFKSKTFTAKGGRADLTKAFKGRRLAKGAKVEIDVAVPGGSTQVFKLTTRAGRKPLQKTA